jgi:hypothetical protein
MALWHISGTNYDTSVVVITTFVHKVYREFWQDLCNSLSNVFFVIKPTRCINFTNLFCYETLHVSESSSVHHQEFIHCTLSNKRLRRIPLSSVQWINSWWWTDKLPETCRVSWQNKCVKLMHLVGLLQRNLLRCMGTWT